VLRSVVIVLFLVGMSTIILGAMLYGSSLSGPAQVISTAVVEAKDLKGLNSDGVSDPYCEVQIADSPATSKTEVQWNTLDPVWDETFQFPEDGSLKPSDPITFQVYDAPEAGTNDPIRRLGYAKVYIGNCTIGEDYDRWLTLEPNLEGDSVSGMLHIVVKVGPVRKAGFEIGVLGGGVVLACVSLVLGFYVWKARPVILVQA